MSQFDNAEHYRSDVDLSLQVRLATIDAVGPPGGTAPMPPPRGRPRGRAASRLPWPGAPLHRRAQSRQPSHPREHIHGLVADHRSTDSRTRADALREALATRVVVADGAMGTMLQAQDPTLEDFQQLEGCNEILNVTRPDIVRSVHEAYFAVGVDCVETNTFGANFTRAGRVRHRRAGLRAVRGGRPDRPRGRRRVRRVDGRQRWVLGSMGPGTKLPTLGHAPYATLRDALPARTPRALIAGGADALLVETTQDLLQTKAVGPRRPPRPGGDRRQPAADLSR